MEIPATANTPAKELTAESTLACLILYFYFHVFMSWGPTGGQQTEYNTVMQTVICGQCTVTACSWTDASYILVTTGVGGRQMPKRRHAKARAKAMELYQQVLGGLPGGGHPLCLPHQSPHPLHQGAWVYHIDYTCLCSTQRKP